MSRLPAGDQIQVKATNNIYTVLACAAVVVQILGLIVIFMRANEVGGIF